MKRNLMVILLCAFATFTKAADMPEFPFVFVYGNAEREMKPNMAVMNLDIVVYHVNPTNGLSKLNETTSSVASFLMSQGVDQNDIISFDINKSIERKRKDYEELEILGYTFSRNLRATIRDIEKYKDIAHVLQSMPNTKNIRTKFDRDDRSAISEELLIEATEDSKTRGARLAKAYGVSLGKIYAVSERGFHDIGIEFGMGEWAQLREKMERRPRYSSASQAQADIMFLPQTITFKQRITAIFRLNVE
jgi:uncharacterized protein YggE